MAFEARELNADWIIGNDGCVPINTNWFQMEIFDARGNLFGEIFTKSIQSIAAFTATYPVLEIHYGNSSAKFPGKASYGDLDVSMVWFCELGTLGDIEAWHARVQDFRTGGRGVPSEYHRDIYISRHDGTNRAKTGNGGVKSVMHLIGCFPTKFSYGDHNQEGGSFVNIDITLAISRYEFLERDQYNQGGTSGTRESEVPRVFNL